ncbi:hypothetical protein ES708_16079 [subsurface metagenome]
MIQPITEAYTAESVGVITRILTEELKLEREGTADPDRSRIIDLESYRKDGSTFWIGLSVSFLRDKNGAAIGLIGVSRDITERKKTEEEMQKFAAVVKHSSELVNLSTLDGRMIFLNESGGKMLGIEPHEVENVNIMEVIPNHLIGLVEKELLPALIKGRTWKGDLQYRNMKTGKLTNVHAMTFTVKDPDTGEPQFLVNVSLDITERKQAEEALKQQNLFLNDILKSLTHPFFVIDAHDYTVKMANSAAGFNLPLKNETCHSITHKSDKPCQGREHQCPLEIVKKTKKSTVVEHLHFDENGNRRIIEISGYPIIDKTGNVIQMIEYCFDITERKQAEEELKKNMKQLERFNKVAVDRELRMIEMKREINDLLEKAGLEKKYSIQNMKK